MKKAILSLVAIMMLAFVSSTYAQDDLYYDPSDDYFTEEVAVEETVQEETATARQSNNSDCSYCYTSRIRRFRNNYRGFNYYDPCYTDAYYYNTAFAGQNIYLVAGSPYSYANNWNRWNSWSRPGNWVTWNSPYYTYGSAYNQYYNTWSNPYGGGAYYGYGNNYGYNYGGYGGYGAADYCPPNAYGGYGSYYADSTPGNTNTAPRGVRTSNFSNPTADTRGGSGRSGSNPDGGKVTRRNNTPTTSTNTTTATRRSTRNNTPSATSSTRTTRTTTPSATRSTKRTSRFGSMMNSGNRNSSSTRSSRSNSSYKPSSTRSSSSRSNSSFRSSSSSSSKSSATRSSSRGGRN